MTNETVIREGVSPARLWTGLLGGAVAWFVHFLLVYGIAEWRCVPPLPGTHFLGMTGTAWLLLAVSVALFIAACAAALLSYRNDGRRSAKDADDDRAGPRPFMAHTGLFTSGLFAFIILVESVSIFFFASQC